MSENKIRPIDYFIICVVVIVALLFVCLITTDKPANVSKLQEYNKEQNAALKKANAEMKKWRTKKMSEAKTARKHVEQGPKWPVDK